MRGTRSSMREAGFTFIELLVVIVIIGLAATAVVLAVPETGGSLEAEAERFAARARTARDAAIVEARPIRLIIGPAGYQVARRSRREGPAAEHRWSQAIKLRPAATRSIRFDPVGLADPSHFTLERGGRRVSVEISHDGNIQVHR